MHLFYLQILVNMIEIIWLIWFTKNALWGRCQYPLILFSIFSTPLGIETFCVEVLQNWSLNWNKKSKHLKGPLGLCVGATFWTKGGQLEPCIGKMKKKSCKNTEMQLQKSLENVVKPIWISLVFAIDDAPRSHPLDGFGLVVQMFVRASFALMADQRLMLRYIWHKGTNNDGGYASRHEYLVNQRKLPNDQRIPGIITNGRFFNAKVSWW